jgi:phosphatidylglycerol:prolipoprotein diacylglycerol transferase
MLQFPAIDPVAFRLGPLAVHWYGLAYLAGIAGGWWLLARRARAAAGGWRPEEVADLVFFAALGGVLGGRLGYVLFSNVAAYLRSPLELFAVWRGGMSFHGGVLGFVAALGYFAWRHRRPFFAVADFVVPVVPLGLLLGRIANFVNQELWGAPSAVPWAVVFTNPAAGGVPRHPSQLYEAALEGLVLFVVLNWLWRRRPPVGTVSAVFLLGYALCRFLVEFVREPDQQLGYLFGGWVTMGQLLSIPMAIAGVAILVTARRNPVHPPPASPDDAQHRR